MSASGAAMNAWPCLAFSHFAFSGCWSFECKFDRFSRIQFPHGSTDKYGKARRLVRSARTQVALRPYSMGRIIERTRDRSLNRGTMGENKMKTYKRYAHLTGNLVMVGFGSIGQAVLPLLFRHLDLRPGQVRIVSAGESGGEVAQEFGVSFTPQALTKENYLEVLEPYLNTGDFLLNLSVDVSSLALIELCHRRGSLYLDTCIEPWLGGYTDPSLTPSLRSNYALREHALDIGRQTGGGPTAVLSHGANPGLASAFVKQALLNIAADTGLTVDVPAHRDDWAQLARALNIKVIHIAEQDTQVSSRHKQEDEFVNTWSVFGFAGEGLQPAELGWGTHERHWPAGRTPARIRL